eukprot:5867886-Amphidinium_carterae.1
MHRAPASERLSKRQERGLKGSRGPGGLNHRNSVCFWFWALLSEKAAQITQATDPPVMGREL